MLTSWIEIVCRGCGNKYRTRVRGSSTRCKSCGRQRYVRVDQAPEWTPEGETPEARPVSCRHCGHAWETRAAGGQTLRCPACRKPKKVPLSWEERTPPPAPRPARPARPRPDRRAPAPATLGTALADLVKLMQSTASTPAPAPPRSAPAAPPRLARPVAAPAPRPAPGVRPWDVPGQRLAIGPRTVQALARVGLGPLAPAVPPGSCTLMDVRMGRPCNAPASRRAVWSLAAFLPVCDGHGHAITNRSGDHGVPVDVMPL